MGFFIPEGYMISVILSNQCPRRNDIFIYKSMIITKHVEFKLTKRLFKKILDRYNLSGPQYVGPPLKVNDIVYVPIEKLAKSSHSLIEVSCDYCNKILQIPYKRYTLSTKVVNKYACTNKNCSNQKIKDVCINKYGVENPFQAEFVKDKTKKTLLKKYGVDHPMRLQETKDKISKTCMDKYGVNNYTKTEEYLKKTLLTNREKYGVDYESKTEEGQQKRKKTRIKNGIQIPDELVSDYRRYRLSVNRITYRLRRQILDNWDGYDYYDGEFISNNFKLCKDDREYPQFDHKISVFYGFYNNLDPIFVGGINNVCITKQWINGLKGEKCAIDFIKSFKCKN